MIAAGVKTVAVVSNAVLTSGIRYRMRSTIRRSYLLLLTLALTACGAPRICAQEEPVGPIHPKAGAKPEPVPQSEIDKQAIRVRVSEVDRKSVV